MYVLIKIYVDCEMRAQKKLSLFILINLEVVTDTLMGKITYIRQYKENKRKKY